MKIYELKISDELIDDITLDELSDYSSVSEIALVENPAIETEWVYFSKEDFETYNDYPRSASENACKVLRWRDEHGEEVKGMTRVGWTRANQLCKREKISEETIARMASFARHRRNAEIAEEYKGTPWKDAGYVAWLGWGGEEGIKWAQRKLRIIERQKFITPNPCWEGYEPIGTKIVDGREVPNCVPLTEMTDDRFDAVVDIDGLPLYKTQSEADSIGASMGCSGSHTHDYEGETLYMPCSNMEETKKLWDEGQTEELNEEKGVELEDILEQGYVIDEVRELTEEDKEQMLKDYRDMVNGKYTKEEFYRIVSSPNEPSIMDSPYRKRRYIYVVGEARAPLISTSRQFCIDMIGKKQLVYRFEDIQMLNTQLTAEDKDRKIIPRPKGTSPDIFRWHGGANCAHAWSELWFSPDTRIPKKQTRAVSKAEVETPAPAGAGQVNPKVVYGGSKQTDLPAFYEYGLPVYEDMDTCVWKSEMMGCKGEYDEINRKGKKYYRACKYKEQTEEFKEQFEFKKDDEKRMIYSPAMLPDRLIRRFDGKDEYWVYFTKETIEKIAHKFLMEKRIDKTNLEHTDKKYDDIYLVESWIITDEKDKAYSLGYTKKDVPIGSWMVGYKVKNDDVWENQIKTGKVKGLSVEGEFELITQSFSKDEYIYNKIINILKNTK